MEKSDFDVIKKWNLDSDPFKAVADYSELKSELRWLNPEHRKGHLIYYQQRQELTKKGTFDDFYAKDISYDRWKYSMMRKAWYIIPLCWDEMLTSGSRIADLGCGDGDIIQRMVVMSSGKNLPKPIQFVGIDSNKYRIKNAKKFVKEMPKTKIDFLAGDIIEDGFACENKHFDYSLCINVLELLDDNKFKEFIDEMCRITKKGIYIVDLIDEYPGGHIRYLPFMLEMKGFDLLYERTVFSEPFHVDKLETISSGEKPLPLFRVKVMFFVRRNQK